MTSLLLLLLVTAMFVQVLPLPTVVGATGFGQDTADDVIIFDGMSCNDIKNIKPWKKKKRICKKNKEVQSSCPQTCDRFFRKECPSKKTSRIFEKDCSKKYQHNRQCDYDYSYTGCTWEDLECTSQQGYTCDYDSSTWNLATTIIEQCLDPPKNFPPFDEECTPCSDSKPAKECPKKEPTIQEDCSAYENDLTCAYDFMITGCTQDELQCSPTSYFTCEQEQGWQRIDALYPPCPTECPSTYKSSEFQDDCSEKYEDNRQCNYDYRYTGCTWDELECTSLQGYTCDHDEFPTWQHEITSIQECVNPPNGLPVLGDCTPCSDVPAEGCPETAPTIQEDCSAFENDLTCDYNLMLTGCNKSELECLPENSFTCSEGKQWEGVAFIPPAPCPTNKCPTMISSEFGMPCQPTYQDGLECKYSYVFTGCTEDTLACVPEETYSCDYQFSNWLVTTVGRQECDPTLEDWPVPQQCSWPEVLDMQYEAAERIIRESDTGGYLTTIEKVVKGSFVTGDHSFHRVRVFVENNTDIVVAIPMVG